MKKRITAVLVLIIAVGGMLATIHSPSPAKVSRPLAVAPATASDPPPGSPAN